MTTQATLRRIAALLRAYGMDTDSFASAIEESLLCAGPPRTEITIPTSLDPDDENVRRAATAIRGGSFQTRAAVNVATAVSGSISLSEAGRLMRLSEHDLRERMRERHLLTTNVGGSVRVPTWQFSDDNPPQLLPHLDVIISAAQEAKMDLSTLGQFMIRPQPALRSVALLTPRAWLVDGNDPYGVTALLRTRHTR